MGTAKPPFMHLRRTLPPPPPTPPVCTPVRPIRPVRLREPTQVAILNTIELLVATMQFVALSAVVGGPAAVSGMGDGGVAAMAILAGLASKMGARAVLCLWFGSDPRTLRML